MTAETLSQACFLIQFLGSHAVTSTCEDLSIDVSITTIGLILTNLLWFLFSV